MILSGQLHGNLYASRRAAEPLVKGDIYRITDPFAIVQPLDCACGRRKYVLSVSRVASAVSFSYSRIASDERRRRFTGSKIAIRVVEGFKRLIIHT
jgi:hypothetical protein